MTASSGRRVWLAHPDEAAAVADLMIAFRDWWGRDWPSDNAFHASVERLIERPEVEYLLGAVDQDSPPAGVCQLRYRFGVWMAAEDCWMEDLFVRDEARRTGLGRALAQAALERARVRGCRRVELDVNEANQGALGLYEGLGFSSFSEALGGHDRLMRLRLEEPPD